MKALRHLKKHAARAAGGGSSIARRAKTDFDFSDATTEQDAGPPPEAVFDRITGPYGNRHTYGFDEET
jgi:hypothetical protein